MKKTKLAVGLLTALLSVGALASCDNTVKYSKDGIILKYVADEKETVITADDILKDYYNDSSKYQSIFDSIYSIVVRNYFNHEEIITEYQGKTDLNIKLGKEQMKKIRTDAQFKVDSDKRAADANADSNNTSYKKEFEAILASKGVETEEELFDQYVEELQKSTFDENFYKYHVDKLKNGDTEVHFKDENDEPTGAQIWTGYFQDMRPYHVSHILVKLEDGSGTNYANGTISEDNAKKLFNVVDALKDGNDSFGTIAYQFSEDTGSAKSYGDLGIMDYSTGYVNEFKLGVYAYKNLVENANESSVTDTVLDMKEAKAEYQKATNVSFGKEETAEFSFPTINYSIFKELKEVADKTKDEHQKAVIGDSATVYPRNIIYNKYLNRHQVALITGDTAECEEAAADANCGFHTYSAANGDGATGLEGLGKILSVKIADEWTPILCVRAGSDYQGIHFIVVNRSPFLATNKLNVSLSEYYTTYYPEQEGYPNYVDATDPTKVTPKKTYVNYSSTVTSDTKSRADGLKSTLKSFDSDKLNKYIFEKYFDFEGIKFAEEQKELKDALRMWIMRGLEKKSKEADEAWEKTWNEYIDTLRKQNSERTKLVSQACKIAFDKANDESETGLASIMSSLINAVEIETGKSAEEAEAIVKSIMVGTTKVGEVKTIADLFKKEGALCNDGQPHI